MSCIFALHEVRPALFCIRLFGIQHANAVCILQRQTLKNLVEMQLHHSYFHTFRHMHRGFSSTNIYIYTEYTTKTCALTTLNAPLNKFNGNECFAFLSEPSACWKVHSFECSMILDRNFVI